MIMSVCFLGFSALLDMIISNYINYQTLNSSVLTPLFSIVAIAIIYPFFCNNNSKYIKTITIFGLIYDLCLTDTLLLNMFIFFLIASIVVYLNEYLSSNSLNTIILVIICIIIYNVFDYEILYIINVHDYGIWYLINRIKNTIILNMLYGWLSYYILGFIADKFKIKRIY